MVVAGAVTVMLGALRTLTVTVPDVDPLPPDPEPPVPVEPTPTDAVTVACWLVVNTITAAPLLLVTPTSADNVPAVVVKSTGEPTNALPLTSRTVAVIVEAPPAADTDCGLALRINFAAAAVPTAILSAPSVPVVAPPETAVIVAVPFEPPATKVTCARPPTSVLTSDGSMRPI